MNPPSNEWTALVVVTQPHGVRGQVKVKSFTEPPENFANYPDLTDEAGNKIALRITGQAQGQFIVSITGIKDRNEAERWRGKKIGATKDALSKIKSEHTYYVNDLVGLTVVDTQGKEIGTVKAVNNYGAGDLLLIAQDTGEEYFSFTHRNFPEVDLKAKRITFTPPDPLGSREEEEGDAA